MTNPETQAMATALDAAQTLADLDALNVEWIGYSATADDASITAERLRADLAEYLATLCTEQDERLSIDSRSQSTSAQRCEVIDSLADARNSIPDNVQTISHTVVKTVSLVVEHGDLCVPGGLSSDKFVSEHFKDESICLLATYSAGDADTLPWPLTSRARSPEMLRAQLKNALFDAREMGFFPSSVSAAVLPDGERIEF